MSVSAYEPIQNMHLDAADHTRKSTLSGDPPNHIGTEFQLG